MVDQNTLEATLKNQQWVGGQTPTTADQEAFEAIKDSDLKPDTHPHLFAWFCLVSKFTEPIRKSWTAAAAAKGGKGAAKGGKKGGKKEEKADDDDMDLFGDDNEDDAAAAAEAKQKMLDAKKPKKVKKAVIAQSLVMFEVKPLDDTTDLDVLAKRIFKELTMDGAYWKTEYKKEPVAFGIFKLIVAVTIEDEKVSVDNDLIEKIEAMDDMVQSTEIALFNKL